TGFLSLLRMAIPSRSTPMTTSVFCGEMIRSPAPWAGSPLLPPPESPVAEVPQAASSRVRERAPAAARGARGDMAASLYAGALRRRGVEMGGGARRLRGRVAEGGFQTQDATHD